MLHQGVRKILPNPDVKTFSCVSAVDLVDVSTAAVLRTARDRVGMRYQSTTVYAGVQPLLVISLVMAPTT